MKTSCVTTFIVFLVVAPAFQNNALAQNPSSLVESNPVLPALQMLHPSQPLWSGSLVGKSYSVAISGNGKYTVAGTGNGGTEGHIYLYDNNGTRLWDYKSDRNIASVAISYDGRYVAAGGYQSLSNGGTGFGNYGWSANPVLYFMSNNGTILWKYETKAREAIWHIAMPSDGSFVLTDIGGNMMSFGRNGSLLWNYTSGNDIGAVSVSSDGNHIVTNTQDRVLYLDNTGRVLWTGKIDSDANARSLISPDGKYVLASSPGGTVNSGKLYLFDDRGNTVWEKPVGGYPTAILAEDQYFAVSGPSTEVFDLKGNLVLGNNESPRTMAISPSNSYFLMSGSFAGETNVMAYDLRGNSFWRFPISDPVISRLSISSGGSYLAFATGNPSRGSGTLHYFEIPQSPDKENSNPSVIISQEDLRNMLPLQQIMHGIPAPNIVCGNGLQLVIKAEGGSPACVRPDTTQILIERGWAMQKPDPRSTIMKLQVWGSYGPGSLYGHFLKGGLDSIGGPIPNQNVTIYVNSIEMGKATTDSSGCFQFNSWDDSKLSSQINDSRKTMDVMNLNLVASYPGNEDHNAANATAQSYLYLWAVPVAPPFYDTTVTPPQVNLTAGSNATFRVSVKPFNSYDAIPHMRLYPDRLPCGVSYNGNLVSDNDTSSTSHPAIFNFTLYADSTTFPGKYFLDISQNPDIKRQYIGTEVGGLVLNVSGAKQ